MATRTWSTKSARCLRRTTARTAFLPLRPSIWPHAHAVRDRDSDGQVGRDSLIGQAFSHYRIVEKLGGGGMGVVYKAEDMRLGRTRWKFVSDASDDPEALGRFVREAQTASTLNHPNICTIHDVGGQDGRSFIVMDTWRARRSKDRLAAGPPEPGKRYT